MEKHGKNVGWKRGFINILIGFALGVLLIEIVTTVEQMNTPATERIRRLHHEGNTG